MQTKPFRLQKIRLCGTMEDQLLHSQATIDKHIKSESVTYVNMYCLPVSMP